MGAALRYVNNLRVALDGNDLTAQIVAQLVDRDGPASWTALGDGSQSHRLITQGTGAISLTRLGPNLDPGEHRLRFSVASDGGKVMFNLYVE